MIGEAEAKPFFRPNQAGGGSFLGLKEILGIRMTHDGEHVRI
jgi:hypothetical protein